MKRIAITGATGFVGRSLVAALKARGDEPIALSRSAATVDVKSAAPTSDVQVEQYDPNSQTQPTEIFEGLDAVVNLAGETVSGRWTLEKKRRIFDSRVVGTRNLVAALVACRRPPPVLVSASASGYYGSRGDSELDETADPGTDFLASVCVEWEREAAAAARAGIRVACLRQGIVVGQDGGALKAMQPPFKLALGGPLGSGSQWWPWIHIRDDVSLFLFAIDNSQVSGAINAVAPNPVTNARFSKALGAALGRPAVLPAPAFALRLLFGEFAESLLASQRLVPARARELGFTFQYENIEQALLDILARR